MTKSETSIAPERPFEGTKVYYSGSISGVEEADLDLPEQLVEYMQRCGADVIDPHVAISAKLKKKEFMAALITSHGLSLEEWDGLTKNEQSKRIYQHDIKLVDRATHIVALLNGASSGVGMELQEALRKPEIGLNVTPILGLVHEKTLEKLSPMIKGAVETYSQFQLRTYSNASDAQNAIHNFLTRKQK